jgi:hypothetical protein
LLACIPHHLPSQPTPGFDPRDRYMDKSGNKIKKNDMRNTLNACTNGIKKCDLKWILRIMKDI